ncbi:MAG: hypothetical protein IPM82_25510 [Saprospiraceae bacterium]|nr:hypothetical protein [Saprospiraceae bacterium]
MKTKFTNWLVATGILLLFPPIHRMKNSTSAFGKKLTTATTSGRAEWDNFEAKWMLILTKQNLRPKTLTLTWKAASASTRASGAGSDGHYLWAGVEWDNFEANGRNSPSKTSASLTSKLTWKVASASTRAFGGKARMATTCGSGRNGPVLRQMKELAKQNLRLIDIETYMDGQQAQIRWRLAEGKDGHYSGRANGQF